MFPDRPLKELPKQTEEVEVSLTQPNGATLLYYFWISDIGFERDGDQVGIYGRLNLLKNLSPNKKRIPFSPFTPQNRFGWQIDSGHRTYWLMGLPGAKSMGELVDLLFNAGLTADEAILLNDSLITHLMTPALEEIREMYARWAPEILGIPREIALEA